MEVIASQDQYKLRSRKLSVKLSESFHCIGNSLSPDFKIGKKETGMVRNRKGYHLSPRRRTACGSSRFMRRNVGWDKENDIEAKLNACLFGNDQVTHVWRVKGPSENADPAEGLPTGCFSGCSHGRQREPFFFR